MRKKPKKAEKERKVRSIIAKRPTLFNKKRPPGRKYREYSEKDRSSQKKKADLEVTERNERNRWWVPGGGETEASMKSRKAKKTLCLSKPA